MGDAMSWFPVIIGVRLYPSYHGGIRPFLEQPWRSPLVWALGRLRSPPPNDASAVEKYINAVSTDERPSKRTISDYIATSKSPSY